MCVPSVHECTFSTLWLSWLQDWFHNIHVSILFNHSGEMKLFLNAASILNPEEVGILCTLLLIAEITGIVSDSIPKPCLVMSSCGVSSPRLVGFLSGQWSGRGACTGGCKNLMRQTRLDPIMKLLHTVLRDWGKSPKRVKSFEGNPSRHPSPPYLFPPPPPLEGDTGMQIVEGICLIWS